MEALGVDMVFGANNWNLHCLNYGRLRESRLKLFHK